MTRFPVRIASSVLLLLPFATKPVQAQQPHDRVPVLVSCACSDELGRTYLRVLHERLAANETFREASSEEASSEDVVHIKIVSHPLAPVSGSPYGRTAIEILCEHNGATMRQSVETCDRLPVDTLPQSMLAALKTL